MKSVQESEQAPGVVVEMQSSLEAGKYMRHPFGIEKFYGALFIQHIIISHLPCARHDVRR